MKNAVIGRLGKIKRSSVSEEIILLSPEDERVKSIEENTDNLFIPIDLAGDFIGKKNVKVYFDLELYPFFQSMKDVITTDGKSKGVLRLRRTLSGHDRESVMVGDLFVLSSVAGEAEEIKVLSTDRGTIPYHVILTIRFSGGKMAHLEYTFGEGAERIEFEWSGIQTIAEFDSDEMNPITPIGITSLPLVYYAEDILEKSYTADVAFHEQLERYKTVVKGGGSE
ncbi:hypothetical protein V6B33_05385 [Mangrovibacillus sp. Mu-81]|jgi:hypothetical protein|uniref:hypothetical protein n=1 Tax=Mangrovibacillus sp. Mu-81 TaxID=3121478 RepID=UPI002FE43074